METPVFPKWLILAKKSLMEGKRGEQRPRDGEIVEGRERERETERETERERETVGVVKGD